MNAQRLYFRLTRVGEAIRIEANGCMDTDTAHLLCKVVVGTLRRYRTHRLELDLTSLIRIDRVGVAAVQVSRREAQRRGVDFIVIGMAEGHVAPRRLRAATGTVCTRRSTTHNGRRT